MLAAAVAVCIAGSLLSRPATEATDREPHPDLPHQLGWVGMVRNAGDVTGKQSRFKWLLKKIAGLSDREKAMLAPHGICVDQRGRMLVADTKLRAVHIFDPWERKYKLLRAPENDPFASPVAVAVDAMSQIYVSDSIRSKIFLFRADGKFLRTIGALGKNESIFKRSTGIAIDSSRGRLYVVDTLASQVVVLTLDGKVLQRIGQRGAEAGQFNYPTQIAIAPDGTFWVTDSLNFRVQHFTPEGKPVNGFGRAGDMVGEFDKAKGIALDTHGNIYVVEGRLDRVQVYGPDGRFLFFFGNTGNREGEFYLPTGIAVDQGNKIYVADSYNRRIEIFQLRPEARLGGGGQ